MNKLQIGCVYFIRLTGLSPVKIGYSSKDSPQERLDAIKTSAPFGAELLGFVISEHPQKLESKLHRELKDVRLNGEWFDITSDKVRSICEKYMHESQKNEMTLIYELYSKAKNTNLPKKIKEVFPPNVLEHLQSVDVQENIRYDKKEIYEQLDSKVRSEISQRKFTALFVLYCESLGYTVFDGKSGNLRWVMIKGR